MSEVILVISNFPDYASAEAAAFKLIANGVAACVNVLPECVSIYRWEGRVERVTEIPLMIKTTRSTYDSLQTSLRDIHPYDLPEIIALPIIAGLPEYLNWIVQETKPRNET
jgi:periplasmic divalent cation tolerance protein